MTTGRRLAFGTAFLALALGAATATLAIASLASGSEERGAVAAVEKTIVKPAPAVQAKAMRPQRNEDAERTVVGFLKALRDGDYARACDRLLRPEGCEEGLAATNAGVREFRLVDTKVKGAEATVKAVADGMNTRFTLRLRDARWWIADLFIDG